MRHRYFTHATRLLSFVIPLALAVSVSGCLLFGLGAAAGAAVGGCALLDENEDERITQAELAAGLYDDWDTDNDDVITEAEFEAGTGTQDRYAVLADDFDDWDTNNDEGLSEAEFRSGVAGTAETEAWLDDECDDLGL